MSSVHCVVVWEWQSNGQWLPHNPGVTRTLERAHAKKLTRVVLADADPALRGHYVNLRTLMQCLDTSDGGAAECRVRRSCYGVQSPAGRGVRWEWASFISPPMGGELNYEPLPMEVQCMMEEAFSLGEENVSAGGWALSLSRMTARRGGRVRLVRRVPHPPYPLTRPAPPQPPPPPPTHRAHGDGIRPRIPQQHTGSSVHSVKSVQSVQSTQSAQSTQSTQSAPANARSVSPKERDRKPGLARQILHNLNIFSNMTANKQSGTPQVESKWGGKGGVEYMPTEEQNSGPDTECDSNGGLSGSRSGSRTGRRHSVDTVSTYLSHESKESLQQASVGELLNCSVGSDDVFDALPLPMQAQNEQTPISDGSIIGVDSASAEVCVWVRAVRCVQWGAVCPVCLAGLDGRGRGDDVGGRGDDCGGGAGGRGAAVALTGCQHLLHLRCLNDHLEKLRANQEPLYIECLVCGRVYGGKGSPSPPGVPVAPLPPPSPPSPVPPAGVVVGGGAQPPGSMAWRLQPTTLPQHPPGSTSILVTYNFQSGRQGPLHPVPGAPYYAVGFPRYSLLPDTPLGRQVLMGLRVAWERRLLFGVCASQTTGREHVVAWRVPPPPAAPAHYAPPHDPRATLAKVLATLDSLTHC